jgi:hypothetical protein
VLLRGFKSIKLCLPCCVSLNDLTFKPHVCVKIAQLVPT